VLVDHGINRPALVNVDATLGPKPAVREV